MNEVEALSFLIYDTRAVCTLCGSPDEKPELTSDWPRDYRHGGRLEQHAFTLLSSAFMLIVAG
jgi:hypothetical protein